MAGGTPPGRYRRIRLERSGGVVGPIRRSGVVFDFGPMEEEALAEILGLLASLDLDRLPERFPGEGYPDSMETILVIETERLTITTSFREGDGHPSELDRIAEWVWERRRR